MRHRKMICLALAGLVVLLTAVWISSSHAAVVLKGGHTGTPKNVMHLAMLRWSDLVKE